jgi:acyl-CoA oxidase
MAYKGTDNGYAVFEHVRIPRTHLLGHHATVSSNGTYTRSPIREKLMYGGSKSAVFPI